MTGHRKSLMDEDERGKKLKQNPAPLSRSKVNYLAGPSLTEGARPALSLREQTPPPVKPSPPQQRCWGQWVPAGPLTAWRGAAPLPGSHSPGGQTPGRAGGRHCYSRPHQLPPDRLCHHQTPRCSTQAEKATKGHRTVRLRRFVVQTNYSTSDLQHLYF